jgi:succinate dehydrogenase (ubiquinone) membrane anchor subunit
MASIVRPALLRQTAITAAVARSATRQVPASVRFTQPAFRQELLKNQTRVAAFHATSKRQLLPPLPRMD